MAAPSNKTSSPLSSVTRLVGSLVLLLHVLRAEAEIAVINHSKSSISVYDSTTNLMVDPMKTRALSNFPISASGVDLFVIERYASDGTGTKTVLAKNLQLFDKATLTVFDSKVKTADKTDTALGFTLTYE